MLGEILALLSLFSALILGFSALKIARGFQKTRPQWIDSTIEEFLSPNENGQNIVDLLADRFGKGFRMSLLAGKSADTRHQQMVEGRVFDAAKQQIPELSLILKALDSFGLGDLATPEELPYLMRAAQKYGLFDMLSGLKGGKLPFQFGAGSNSASGGNPFDVK